MNLSTRKNHDLIPSLLNCSLFKGMNREQIMTVLQQISWEKVFYHKAQVLAMEGDVCRQVSIILTGRVMIRKIYGSGKSVTITTLSVGDTFGEVMVYTDHRLPSTIMAHTDVTLLQISRTDMLRICQLEPQFLENLFRLLSQKVWMLNETLKLLSYHSIRQKVAGTLLELHQVQRSEHLTLQWTRQEMADRLGIPRPSLSREMAAMKRDGIIDYWKNHLRILDLEALENILLQ